jgi:hypothetical protein
MVEQNANFESKEQRGKNEFLIISDFEGLENITILPYEGVDNSEHSFSRDLDGKKKYLTELGIDISKFEGDKSLVGTLFIVATDIVVTEYFRRDLIKLYGSTESEEFKNRFQAILNDENVKLEESRRDRFGYRRELLTEPGVRNEDIRRKLGLPANPKNKISSGELHELIQHALSELKK